MGVRSGVVPAVMALVVGAAVPAAAEGGAVSEGGPFGAIHPDLEIEVAAPGDAAPEAVSNRAADVAVLLEGDGAFTWADRPYAMETRSAASLGIERWHDNGRVGDGVKVAVVDLGFSGYRGLLGTELPDSVTTATFRSDGTLSGGTAHGTAAAEIVHDVAPGADLHLVAYDGDLFRVVQHLIEEEVDLVSFSVGYLSGPFDGTSPASRAVQWAIDSGIAWVSAAGNYAEDHWGGSPGDTDGDGWVEMAGADEINEFTVAGGAEFHLYLSWVGGGDLDLCLYEMPAVVDDPLACASGRQDDDDRGLEVARWKNASSSAMRYGFSVRKVSGSPAGADVLVWNTGGLEHAVAEGSVVAPADVADAVTVGAVWWTSPGTVLSFSGRGPTQSGVTKPDLVAPTGLATASWGSFGGTSGATPQVAGTAALLLEAYPATGANELGSLLTDRARSKASGPAGGAGLASAGPRTPACSGLAPTITGTTGADRLTGTPGPDVIHGRAGDDVIRGGGGADIICAGSGDDVVYGDEDADRILGNGGDDRLFGGHGRDRVFGGSGADRVSGGDHNDRVSGGAGDDLLWGGGGRDRCTRGEATGCE